MEPFLGEIRAFAFGFVPYGWAACNGQLMSISQYTALFSILGTYYGGNGQTNFALPNLQTNVVLGAGRLDGSGTIYSVGENGGVPAVALVQSQMPMHNHTLNGATANLPATTETNVPASDSYISNVYGKTSPGSTSGVLGRGFAPVTGAPMTQLNIQTVGVAGGSGGATAAHTNMMPYLTFTYCIALQGNYPVRN